MFQHKSETDTSKIQPFQQHQPRELLEEHQQDQQLLHQGALLSPFVDFGGPKVSSNEFLIGDSLTRHQLRFDNLNNMPLSPMTYQYPATSTIFTMTSSSDASTNAPVNSSSSPMMLSSSLQPLSPSSSKTTFSYSSLPPSPLYNSTQFSNHDST